MYSNIYTAFLGCIFFILLNFIGLSSLHSQEEGDIVDLRFLTELDCSENILTANIQIRTQDDTFKIGTSSILFTYDETVLEFMDYESLNFDKNNVCIPGVPLAVWDNHQFSSSTPGVFNLTLLAEIASASCPIIERDWIDIGKVRFVIKNIEASPNMQFDSKNSPFNRNDPNDGTFAPTQGDLIGFDELLASQCVAVCNTPTLFTDTLTFECPETSIEANLLANDNTTNPTISIVSNPTKGTASINPNGTLTYTPTEAFCGEDVLTYKVCNDGSADCCSEAMVFISMLDDTPPTFVDAPADLTIDCGQLTEIETIQATDNCVIADITTNERIEEGSCPGEATHIRTWIASDICGNQTTHTQMISIIDNEAPTIECPGIFSALCSDIGTDSIDSGQPTIADNCTSIEALNVSFTDEVITENCENFIQKQIARTWTVVDACGNFSTCTQTINIIDDVAPEISCPEDITVNCGSSIAPDTLSSQPLAMDNCSEVTISFVDDESMPIDCNFDTTIITRTWTAPDACGNATNCTQKITISGDPCPVPTTKDLTVYRCEQDVIDFKALLTEANDVIISISSSSDIPVVTDIQQYALPATGCTLGEFVFTYNISTLEECLVESGTLLIKTVPNFIGETVLAEDGCTANLILECPELYSVTWNVGTDSGTGTSYTASPGTSGEVIFSVIYIGDTLVNEAAVLPCVEKLYTISFNCEIDCPTVENHEADLTTCAGQNFDIIETLNLFVDSLDYTFTFIDSTLGIEFGAVPSKVEIGNPFGCEVGTFSLIANGYDANQCLVKSINIAVQVLPKIEAFVNYGTDSTFCAPQLILECPMLFSIEWKDNFGDTGVGNTYTGASGTAGFVTFFVYPIDENIRELPCAVDSFFADFSCMTDCPQPIERQEQLTVCAESEVNIIDLLGLNENKRNTFDSDEIVNGIYKVGNPFGCELGTKTFSLKCFDENQCLVEIITLNIVVIPAVYGEIITPQDVACNLLLNLECPENYIISWEDTNGNSGNGPNYTGPENTAGTVKFTVEYLTEVIILSSDSLGCFSQTFEADYNCIIDCPGISTEEQSITVCGGELLDIPDYLNFGANAEYFISGIELDAANNYKFINEECEIKEKTFTVELFDGVCLIKVISVTAIILPNLTGTIQYLSDSTFCTPKLLLSCENNFQITWSDNLGNSGAGNIYEAAEGTTGFVTFYVTPFDTLNETYCIQDTFFADFSCGEQTVDCPMSVFETMDLYGCEGEIFNLFNRLQFSENTIYRLADAGGIEDIKNIRLENNRTDCFISQSRLAIDVLDDRGCVTKTIFISFNVLPKIVGELTNKEEGCGVNLTLTCPNIYAVSWVDDLGNTGEGFSYESELGTTGLVNFTVSYKDSSIANQFIDSTCVIATFQQDFVCCNPASTACDDGDALTFNDVEDGNCACFGTGCNLEHKGKVIGGSELAGCCLLIE
ncbi:MAG: Ig-like domain-containing protein, partial [Saprospiraceae bacterium]